MALWDNLGKKTTETTAKAIQKAKELSDITKLNSMISDEEKKISNNYYQIGKLYVSIHRTDYEEDFAGMVLAVKESEDRISSYKMQIQDIKGVIRCEKCGAEVPRGVAFCSSCGAEMPKAETIDLSRYERCENCGAVIERGMRFCTSCGNPMPAADKPVEMENAEATPVQEKIVCPQCGAKLNKGVQFCTECGTKIQK